MKTIIAVITETDIRTQIEEAIAELEEDDQIHIPDDNARTEFVEDCVACTIDKYEFYGRDPIAYQPNYKEIILDFARSYEYTN